MKVPTKALLKEGFSEKDASDPNFQVFQAKGCDQCTSGYKGRVGIYQVMEVSEEMERMVMEGRNAIDIADQARREGIPDLRQSGLKKVKDGVLSIEEMNRVTQE
jgi:type IV pilus assembly protein PilB